MERVCPKCGTLVTEGKFCPNCGTVLEEAVNLDKPQTDAVPNPAPVEQYSPQFNNNPAENTKSMSVGQWVGTILLTSCLGLVSFILLIVWGFGKTTPQPRKNYCKAMFFINLVLIIIGIIISVIFGIFIVNNMSKIEGFFSELGRLFRDHFGDSVEIFSVSF